MLQVPIKFVDVWAYCLFNDFLVILRRLIMSLHCSWVRCTCTSTCMHTCAAKLHYWNQRSVCKHVHCMSLSLCCRGRCGVGGVNQGLLAH